MPSASTGPTAASAPTGSSGSVWQPGPRPPWVQSLNRSGSPAWISLDEASLVEEATRSTGLDDFGGSLFWEPLRIFLEALEQEARLHLAGRVLARADLLNWLENRLRIAALYRRHPEIEAGSVQAPIVVTGLPRTGTSILHELLAQDPAHRAPRHWEVRHPCPPPERASREDDPRIERAEQELGLWSHIVPEYDTMHELGARLPVECIQITAHEFRSDELPGRHRVPGYAAWLAGADPAPAYAFHRRMLKLLQWRCPGRWVLKAPSHLGSLDALLAVYPDARIVWTHRDPLCVIASVASILCATLWVRSDAVDPDEVLGWFTPERCAALLEAAERVRARGAGRFVDVRHADLAASPLETIGRLYDQLGVPLSAEAEARMRAWLAARPRGRHGPHRYGFDGTGLDRTAERQRFAAYQARYGVAPELT